MTETMTAQLMLPATFSDALVEQITSTVNTAVTNAIASALEGATTSKSPYLTIHEAMSLSTVSRNTLTKWLSGGLKHVTIDGVTRIKRDDLASFMDSHVKATK